MFQKIAKHHAYHAKNPRNIRILKISSYEISSQLSQNHIIHIFSRILSDVSRFKSSYKTCRPYVQCIPSRLLKSQRVEEGDEVQAVLNVKCIQSEHQWDQYRILHSGPLGPGCCNGENPDFQAQSGPFPDHFLNFSGPLVVLPV